MAVGWLALVSLAALAVLSMASCGGDDLVIGVSTSVRDTGLLDELVDEFKRQRPDQAATVKPVAAGSGQLIELALRGEVDILIIHLPGAEAKLIADGDGIDRRELMHNFFALVGPPDDPARAQSTLTMAEALKRIAATEKTFISRGDNSGTHLREMALWRQAGIDPVGESWYQESGAGQGQSLLVASDKGAYTLVDSGTFVVFQERLELELYVSDEEPNQYSIIRVNPDKHGVNEAAALAFAEFLTSPAGQRIIAGFGLEKYGEPLFVPAGPGSDSEPAATPER
ncbi:MAG: substrate-binding domain-containing protein [Chloroflexi bacterium]|nr:substrate-binding domain-containing protein [Chloroflexota bacterium]